MLWWIAFVHAEQIVRFARWLSVLGWPCVMDLLEYFQCEYHTYLPFVVSVNFRRVVCSTGMDGSTPGMWTIVRQALVAVDAASDGAFNSIEFTFTRPL
jgi:hypothetical protein